MMDGAEEVGSAVGGALVARAVEPEAGEHERHGHGACLNCGAEVRRNYCPECGQPAHVHRTLSAFLHDLMHSVLHFEGKMWATLPMLAWRPGELTRRYVDGERAKFVSPMALFLFSVFLMFAIFGLMGTPLIGVGKDGEGDATAEVQKADQAIQKLEEQRRIIGAKRQSTEKIDEEIGEARMARELLAAANGIATTRPMIESDIKTGWARLDKGIEKANRNPALLLYKLQTNAYKFSWALIPISVPFVWLLFLHRRPHRQEYRAYDHVVFVTYSIAFFSILGIALVLLRVLGVPGGMLGLAFLVIPPIHMYRQLRGAYRLSRFSAIWRAFVLLNFTGVAAGLFLLLLLALGVLG